MANNWHEMTTRPAGKRLATDGTVYVVGFGTPDYNPNERPYATVQPGRGLTEQTNHSGADAPTFMAPAEHPSEYAREFGRTPGPEWTVNGKPFAGHVRLYAAANAAEDGHRRPYSDAAHVEFPTLTNVTDAGRRAISEWLTSPEVLAEVFSPARVAEARDAEARSALYYARRDEDEARRAHEAATDAVHAAEAAAAAAAAEWAALSGKADK